MRHLPLWEHLKNLSEDKEYRQLLNMLTPDPSGEDRKERGKPESLLDLAAMTFV